MRCSTCFAIVGWFALQGVAWAASGDGSQGAWDDSGDGRGPAPSRNALPGASPTGALTPNGGPVGDRRPASASPLPTPTDPTRAPTRIDAAGLAALLTPTPGERARVVALFATWCPPCEVELAQLGRLAGDAGADLVVVSLDPVGTDVRGWLDTHAVRAPAYHLPEHEAAEAILAVAPDWPQTLPATFVFPREGRPVRRFDGVAPAEALGGLLR